MQTQKNSPERGITLIELLVVVTIIGILAAIASVTYTGYMKRADRAEATSNLQALRLLEEQFFAENNSYAPSKDGVENIQTVLPGFKPGADSQLKYNYKIEKDIKFDGTSQTPCFRATATPRTGTRVEGEAPFAIDCNNNKNF
ncbi:MAG: type IV pilin protein [Nitrospirota bacterium]